MKRGGAGCMGVGGVYVGRGGGVYVGRGGGERIEMDITRSDS